MARGSARPLSFPSNSARADDDPCGFPWRRRCSDGWLRPWASGSSNDRDLPRSLVAVGAAELAPLPWYDRARNQLRWLRYKPTSSSCRSNMAKYSAQLLWLRNEQDFLDNRYSRRHVLRFDGGVEVAASSSPHVVPQPMSDPAAVDPEEAFVASLAELSPAVVPVDRRRTRLLRRSLWRRSGWSHGQKRRGKAGHDRGHAAPRGAFLGRSPANAGRGTGDARSGARGVLHRQFGALGSPLRAAPNVASLPTGGARAALRRAGKNHGVEDRL